MATVIGVGMQMTASAAGMTKGLSEADRALQLLQKIVEQNQQSLETFGGAADKAAASLQGIGDTTSILAAIEVGRVLFDVTQAIAAGFTRVGTTISSIAGPVAKAIDTINDLSARTGINVEQLQKYSFAAKLAGVDTLAFGKAVQTLSVNIGKATPGGELDKALRGLNLSVAELRALAPEKQIAVIGEAIAQLPTAADRAAASVAVFGKQGAALAPLFREGAASIEELQARAERLGIIVSETQVNNVAAMNDAFDTVRATIEGIIGQVIGNLAPAVTAVTEEFLRFVEEWSGSQGQGGTGIANAITDVLLRGAQYFAGVFDGFVSDFGSFLPRIENVSAVFSAVSNTLIALGETFRVIFNVFEGIGNGIALALGKVLEGIGSWVSSDMEAFGRSLQENARAAMAQNNKDLESAATNAANAVVNVFTGSEASPEAAGNGAASKYLRSLEEQIKQARLPEVKLRLNLEETQTRLDGFLKSAGDGASDFLQKSQETVRFFRESAEAGNLTAAEIKVMAGFAKKVNDELSKEQAKRDQILQAAAAQASADESRIANLLKANDAQVKIADDLAAVEREQLRVQQELNAARESSQQQQADQAAARLAQLDQLQASLQEQQQSATQGFADGFTKSFDVTNKSIEELIQKTGEFGQQALAAAQNLRDGIAETQSKVRSGFLSREAYEAEVAARRQAFDVAVQAIRQEEQEKLAAAKRVDDFLRQGIDARLQAEIDATKQLEERKKQAAKNVAAIQAKIDEQQRQLQENREKGDLKAARQDATRLKQLQALQRNEQKIADGTGKRSQAAIAQAQQGQANFDRMAASLYGQQIRSFNNAVTESIGGVNNALAASADNFRKMMREERASMMLGPQQIAVSDVRTAEGQQMILDAAAQYQDPALIQMRKSNQLLGQIAQGLTQNLSRIGVPAAI